MEGKAKPSLFLPVRASKGPAARKLWPPSVSEALSSTVSHLPDAERASRRVPRKVILLVIRERKKFGSASASALYPDQNRDQNRPVCQAVWGKSRLEQ